MEGDELKDRPLFFHFPIYLQAYSKKSGVNRDPLFRTRPGTAVRYGDWKLIYYYEDQKSELFNLKEDIGETTNLVSKYPKKAEQLKKLVNDWIKETNAPIPTELNPEFNFRWSQQQIEKFIKE